MSSVLSVSPSGRGVCGAEDCVEETGGLGYDVVMSKNAAASVIDGEVRSMQSGRVAAAGVCDGSCGDRVGPNVRR
jgi:hypothetical protein